MVPTAPRSLENPQISVSPSKTLEFETFYKIPLKFETFLQNPLKCKTFYKSNVFMRNKFIVTFLYFYLVDKSPMLLIMSDNSFLLYF